ncbi:MAG TPA: hypothetical protein VN457_06135, partial [Chlamydiales bacterium]|nr:hypothetical protein [Chlamydiales bacterium]
LMQPRKASQAPAVPKPAVPKTAGSKTVVPGPSGPSVRASGVPLQVVVPLDDKNMRLLSEYLIQKSVVQVLQLIASLPRLSSSELAGVHYALSKDPKISKEKLHAVWTVVTTALDLEDALKKLPNDTSVNTHVIAQLRKKSVLIETLGQAALAFIVDRLQAHPDAAIKKGHEYYLNCCVQADRLITALKNNRAQEIIAAMLPMYSGDFNFIGSICTDKGFSISKGMKEKTFKDPALSLLRLGSKVSSLREAFAQGRLAEALEIADSIHARVKPDVAAALFKAVSFDEQMLPFKPFLMIKNEYVKAIRPFFPAGSTPDRQLTQVLQETILEFKAGKKRVPDLQAEMRQKIVTHSNTWVELGLQEQKVRLGAILKTHEQKAALNIIDRVQAQLLRTIQGRLSDVTVKDYPKALEQEMEKLRGQVDHCRSYYNTRRPKDAHYLDQGICYGSTVNYAAARVHGRNLNLAPDRAARFSQAAMMVESLRTRRDYETPKQIREKLEIRIKYQEVPANCTPEMFLNEIDSYEDIHCLPIMHTKADANGNIGAHAIYISTTPPFEVQDVNYPNNQDFRSDDYREFKLYFAFWFAMHPQYTEVFEVEKVTRKKK